MPISASFLHTMGVEVGVFLLSFPLPPDCFLWGTLVYQA